MAKMPDYKYSGPKSTKFWDRVNTVKGLAGNELYEAACDLQNKEAAVLRQLADAEETQQQPSMKRKAAK